LGAESAVACSRAGASTVILTDLKSQAAKADDVAKRISDLVGDKTKVLFYELDVVKEDQWISVFEKIHAEVGPIDVLLNSAGIGIGHQVLEDIPLEDWERWASIRSSCSISSTSG